MDIETNRSAFFQPAFDILPLNREVVISRFYTSDIFKDVW